VSTGVVDLEFGVILKIGEGEIDGDRDQGEVDGLRGVAGIGGEGNGILRDRKFFVGHPLGDFDELGKIRFHVAGMFYDRAQAIEHGTADGLGPAEVGCGGRRFVQGHGRGLGIGWSCRAGCARGNQEFGCNASNEGLKEAPSVGFRSGAAHRVSGEPLRIGLWSTRQRHGLEG